MRLVTFNILNGRTPADGQVDPDRLRAAISLLDPDVLGLQEVDHNQPRSHHADLTAVAAEAMKARAHRFVAALDGTPGARWVAVSDEGVPDHALYGIALLSRFPVRSWEVLRLPNIGPHFPFPVPGQHRSMVVGEEPRSALIAHVDSPRGPLAVANTHLSFLPGWNVVQLRRIVRRLYRTAGPAVIMGDLNLPAGLPAGATGFRPMAAWKTYPVHRPALQLDHILLRGDLGEIIRSEAVSLPLSDHRALVVETQP
jgi:endonuclease/exonuclease/phosphatase family metal-dependent hydrolase